jgi:hypothetical protein
MVDLGGLALTLKEEAAEVFAMHVIFCGLQVLSAFSSIILKNFLQECELSCISKYLMFKIR